MDTDTIISLASAIIALSALLLAVCQSISLKKHNKLSVRPLLQFNYHSELGQKVMVHVTNGGLGPAILRELKVKINGKETEINEQFWNLFFKGFEGKNIPVWLYFLSGPDILQEKEEKEILRIESKPGETIPADLESKIDELCFIITYESMYGEKFKAQSSTHRRSA